jgi:hypothetical protein
MTRPHWIVFPVPLVGAGGAVGAALVVPLHGGEAALYVVELDWKLLVATHTYVVASCNAVSVSVTTQVVPVGLGVAAAVPLASCVQPLAPGVYAGQELALVQVERYT